jgi:3-oxoacyl-[acyl-carrier-protein] synthase II
MTSPDPEAKQSARCFTNVVKDAGLELTDIDYINAHGTSTPLNERTETAAIKHAYKLSISSIKSMIGHLLGAAGGIECIATALAVKNDIMPATINYETPDEELDLDYVPNVARERVINAAISDSLGFGGHNAAILLKKLK